MLDDFSDFRLPTSEVRSAEERRWTTVDAEAQVLAVVRTVPSARRLLDVGEAFAGDSRVELRWAVDPGSELGGGVRDVLAARRIRPLRLTPAAPGTSAGGPPWRLVLAASANSPLDQLGAPVPLLPHGARPRQGMAAHTPPPWHPRA